MTIKLNAMRTLDQHKIPYEVVTFSDELRDAELIAEVLGIPPFMVYKTLVALPDGVDKPFLCMLAADRRLDLKKLALAAGVRKVRLVAHKDAEALTGLKVGGISALALIPKGWKVFLDEPASQLQHILVSGGQRGIDLRVPVAALMGLLRPRIAAISADDDAHDATTDADADTVY